MVHVTRKGDRVRITGVELDGEGGYEPGTVQTIVEKQLSDPEWTLLSSSLARAAFWGMRTRGDNEGLDGAQWILEGRRADSYHVVHRWSPKEGAFRQACLALLRTAGLMPAHRYVY